MNRNDVKNLKAKYPAGTVVVLDHMDDKQAPPAGTKGTVTIVDDIGQIHVDWENGSTLAVIPGVDRFHTASPDWKCEECPVNHYCGLIATCESAKEMYEKGRKAATEEIAQKIRTILSTYTNPIHQVGKLLAELQPNATQN